MPSLLDRANNAQQSAKSYATSARENLPQRPAPQRPPTGAAARATPATPPSLGGSLMRGAARVANPAILGYEGVGRIVNSGQNTLNAAQNPSFTGGIDFAKNAAINQGIAQPLDRLGLLDPLRQGYDAVGEGAVQLGQSLGEGYDAAVNNLSNSPLMSLMPIPESGGLTPDQTRAMQIQDLRAGSQIETPTQTYETPTETFAPQGIDRRQQQASNQGRSLITPEPQANRGLNIYGEPVQNAGIADSYRQYYTNQAGQQDFVEVTPWNRGTGESLSRFLPKSQYIDYAGQGNVAYDASGNPTSIPLRLNPELGPQAQQDRQRTLGMQQQGLDIKRARASAPAPNKYDVDPDTGRTYPTQGAAADRAFQQQQKEMSDKQNEFFNQVKKRNPNITNEQLMGAWRTWLSNKGL